MLVAACDSTQRKGPADWEKPSTSSKGTVSLGGPADPYEKAAQTKAREGCEAALPQYEKLAAGGAAYGVAQLDLGRCYLELAAQSKDPADVMEKRTKGAAWIIRSAQSQLPAGQEAAARLYLEHSIVQTDLVEAAKWLLVLDANPLRYQTVPSQTADELKKRLRAQLTPAQWHEAEERAKKWTPTGSQLPPT